MNYEKMQFKKVHSIMVWQDYREKGITRICLGKIGFWFFIKAMKTWIFNTCLEIEGKTITKSLTPPRHTLPK